MTQSGSAVRHPQPQKHHPNIRIRSVLEVMNRRDEILDAYQEKLKKTSGIEIFGFRLSREEWEEKARR